MGLFGKGKEEDINRHEEEQRVAELQAKKIFNDRVALVDRQNGIIVQIKPDAVSKDDYKLTETEEEYILMYYVSPKFAYRQSLYDDIQTHPDIHLKKDECRVELIPVEEKASDSGFCKGEKIYESQPIPIKFSMADKAEIIAEIHDIRQDISQFASLLKKIGVKNFRNIIDIPEDNFIVEVKNGNGFLEKENYIFFRTKDRAFFVRDGSTVYHCTINMASVKIDDILYYKSEGSLRYEQKLSGGDGAGVNYGGAIVGGLLFGGVGAMIGSRHGEDVKEIESTTITHDDRIITLVIKEKGEMYQIGFDIGAEAAFDWLLPDKQYDYVISKRREMYEKE